MPIDASDRSDPDAFDGQVPIVPQLEEDETVPPRPEEEIAEAVRAEPDLEDHSAAGEHSGV